MNDINSKMQDNSGEITLSDILSAAWKRRNQTLVIVVLSMCLTAIYVYSEDNIYRSEVLLAPQSQSNGAGQLANIGDQFGSLASLAGINLKQGGREAEFIAYLRSRGLIEKFIIRNNLLPEIFNKRWNKEKNEWKSPALGKKSTVWFGIKEWQKNIGVVVEDKKTGLVTLVVEWTDPAVAAEWCRGIVELANEELRNKSIQESDDNLEYLRKLLQDTNIVELRSSIYKLIEQELKSSMIARGNHEFAFKIIDPADEPMEKTRPKRLLSILMSGIAAMIAGLFLSVMQQTKREKESTDIIQQQ